MMDVQPILRRKTVQRSSTWSVMHIYSLSAYHFFVILAANGLLLGALNEGSGPHSNDGVGLGVPGDFFGSCTELCFLVEPPPLRFPGRLLDGLKSSSGGRVNSGISGDADTSLNFGNDFGREKGMGVTGKLGDDVANRKGVCSGLSAATGGLAAFTFTLSKGSLRTASKAFFSRCAPRSALRAAAVVAATLGVMLYTRRWRSGKRPSRDGVNDVEDTSRSSFFRRAESVLTSWACWLSAISMFLYVRFKVSRVGALNVQLAYKTPDRDRIATNRIWGLPVVASANFFFDACRLSSSFWMRSRIVYDWD